MRKTAIVLAGGTGNRMHADRPKQFLSIAGHPILYYSLKVFADCAAVDDIVLVTRTEDVDYCRKEIVEAYSLPKIRAVTAGGAERVDSVYQGLLCVAKDSLVLIHDGARPCLDEQTLLRLLEDADKYGNAVASVPGVETIRLVDEKGFVTSTPPRASVRNMQTPQIFSARDLLAAYREYDKDTKALPITDDAMLIERYTDRRIHLSMGAYENIKVTTPEDLVRAEQILAQRSAERP